MKNKLSDILKSLPSIAIVIVFMGSICANYISYNYIEELEKQIDVINIQIEHDQLNQEVIGNLLDG